MPDVSTNAASALANWYARLAELDAVPVETRAQMSYTDDNGRSVGWNEYRASLLASIEKLGSGARGQSSLAQQVGAPFTILG